MTTFGIIHDFGKIVVIDDGLGRSSVLSKATRHVAQGSVAEVVLRTKPRRQGQQKHPRNSRARVRRFGVSVRTGNQEASQSHTPRG